MIKKLEVNVFESILKPTKMKKTKMPSIPLSQETMQANRERSLEYFSGGNGIVRYIGEEFDHVEIVYQVISLAKKIQESDEILFYVAGSGNHSYVAGVGASPTGQSFLSVLPLVEAVELHFRMHRFDIHYETFVHEVRAYNLAEMRNLKQVAGLEASNAVSILNRCVASMRSNLRSNDLEREKAKVRRASNKNSREIMRYIKAHARVTRKLLIVRLDLGYRTAPEFPPLSVPFQTTEMVLKQRVDLFRAVKKTFCENFVGFAWKLEYGTYRGFHYHVVLIFDGRKLRQDILIARMIGEKWNKIITEDAGTYFNCNAIKSTYKSCGVGMFNPGSNPAMWDGVKKMALYITKPDDYIRLELGSDRRTFGKGNMPSNRKN